MGCMRDGKFTGLLKFSRRVDRMAAFAKYLEFPPCAHFVW